MTIGQRIAQKRKELGLSQEALGDRLEVSRQSIYKWESGVAVPEVEKLIALSRLFGVSVGWLLGVESPAAPAAGELTEAQTRMVEELARRYAAALPKPRRSAWDKWSVRLLFALCGLMLVLLYGISGNMRRLDGRYDTLQAEMGRVEHSVDRQIGGISDRVEAILKAQNDLTADYGTELLRAAPDTGGALFSAYAIPRTYVEGMTAQFCVDDGGGVSSVDGVRDGETFSAQVPARLTDAISLSVVFLYPDGTRQTQLLDSYSGLYSASLPWVELSEYGYLLGLKADEAGRVLLPERYVSAGGSRALAAGTSARAPAEAVRVRVGLFQNRALVRWLEPCGQPESIRGDLPAGEQFFRLPETAVTLAPGADTLCFAAVVTDEYGRETVCESSPYLLEDGALTWPSASSSDTDPTHWHYDET
ncbi:helix-turn-helix domain-containing protein [uncultured Oscillibacter sp.]|uniref:helix-turn-helix domain-containing protein n=1 Tax=uncultured Oscillibacter sp. TaxID=876091 RepID=UPI0025DD3619|nr:helix-turn-helix transcriptional regulator [uncultured Oscillibacter sp.]